MLLNALRNAMRKLRQRREPTSQIIIRQAIIDDNISGIKDAIFPSWWDSSPDVILVAEWEGMVCGYVAAYKSSGYVDAIAVLPKYRRRGVGTTLIEAMSKKLRKRGLWKIWLNYRTSHNGTAKFWQQLGFKRDRYEANYYPNGDGAQYVSKAL